MIRCEKLAVVHVDALLLRCKRNGLNLGLSGSDSVLERCPTDRGMLYLGLEVVA